MSEDWGWPSVGAGSSVNPADSSSDHALSRRARSERASTTQRIPNVWQMDREEEEPGIRGGIPQAPSLAGSTIDSIYGGGDERSVGSHQSQNSRRSQRSRQSNQSRNLGGESRAPSIPRAPPLGVPSHIPDFVDSGGAAAGAGAGIDAIGLKYQQFFSAMVDANDYEIQREGVLLPKELRGTPESREYAQNMDLATTSIDHKFGVAYHFVSSRDGEPEEGNQTKQQYVQDSFVTNLKKRKTWMAT